MIWTNSRGKQFQTGIGGTYPVNNGNPENDVDDPREEELANEIADQMEDDPARAFEIAARVGGKYPPELLAAVKKYVTDAARVASVEKMWEWLE